jgi:hypothetical protein
VVSAFCRELEEICALLGHYAANSVISHRSFGPVYGSPSLMVRKYEIYGHLQALNVRWICGYYFADLPWTKNMHVLEFSNHRVKRMLHRWKVYYYYYYYYWWILNGFIIVYTTQSRRLVPGFPYQCVKTNLTPPPPHNDGTSEGGGKNPQFLSLLTGCGDWPYLSPDFLYPGESVPGIDVGGYVKPIGFFWIFKRGETRP